MSNSFVCHYKEPFREKLQRFAVWLLSSGIIERQKCKQLYILPLRGGLRMF